jgi:Protein of unknown function, DUF547
MLNPHAGPSDSDAGRLSQELVSAARERTWESADRLEDLEGALRGVDPAALAGDENRLAFWLNLYNGLVLRVMRARPRSGSLLRQRGIFRRCGYRVGELDYSLDAIEHGLLRANARPPYSARRVLRPGDPRLAAAPASADPRIHFALNCGARSCPPARVYEANRLDDQLEGATRGYLEAECDFDRQNEAIALPGLIKLYRSDFGARAQQVEFVAAHLPAEAGWLRRSAERLRVRYNRFDWTIVAAN